jgi:hypothetical protein
MNNHKQESHTEEPTTIHSDNGINRVSADRYQPLMSTYLSTGRRQEVWHINWIEWDGEILRASARLEGWVTSKTDNNKFHLSIYAAREIDAQLSIIGIHLKLGLSEKSAEVWLLKCVENCSAAITTPEDVRFEMNFRFRRSQSGKLLSERLSRIYDQAGGEIRLNVLALMPWNTAWGEMPDEQ